MKTAISIPDSLFAEADQLARQLGVSRSEFYVRAVSAFVASCQTQLVTEMLNRVYAAEDSLLDPVVAQIQAAAISHEVW